MRSRQPSTSSYRLHRPSGQAVVTIGGRDFYLGPYNFPESRDEYDRVLAEWLAAGRPRYGRASEATPADLTVSELLAAYLLFVDGYYVKNGQPVVSGSG